MSNSLLSQEATLLARHLVGVDPTEQERGRYGEALAALGAPPNDRLGEFALRYPFLLPYLDGGLALVQPEHSLRQRLYIMLAILEASPSHVRSFVYQPSPWWMVKLLATGFNTTLHSLVGTALVLVLSLIYAKKS